MTNREVTAIYNQLPEEKKAVFIAYLRQTLDAMTEETPQPASAALHPAE